MYEFLKGILIKKQPMAVVVEVNGIGYGLRISLSTYQHLPEEGNQVLLKTYLHVREDVLQLYGFFDDGEREIFAGLLSVSGVGPKLAQTILSGLSPDRLVQAIQQNDERALQSISGVGKKTAQRLVIELKDKFKKFEKTLLPTGQLTHQPLGLNGEEAVMALLSLGYGRPLAERAVNTVAGSGNTLTVEDLIKQALRVI